MRKPPTCPTLTWPGRPDAGASPPGVEGAEAAIRERVGSAPRGLLIEGDNLAAGAALLREHAGKVDLIYIDPPFDVGADFRMKIAGTKHATRAYRDRWGGGTDAYLQRMWERLSIARSLLAPNGSLMVHCDWRAAHQLRLLLDELLGRERFLNEIIWAYGAAARGAKAVARQLPRNHDSILWYAAGDGHVFHPPKLERVYTAAQAAEAGFRRDAKGRWFKTAPRGDYTDQSIARLDAEERVHRTASGSVRVKYFLESVRGKVVERVALGDVWSDIPDAMHLPRAERTGYATQKPMALLERLIGMSTGRGALVLDLFCGSGVTAAAAEKLGRRWIACDVGALAVGTTYRRLSEAAAESGGGFALADTREFEAARWRRARHEVLPSLARNGAWDRARKAAGAPPCVVLPPGARVARLKLPASAGRAGGAIVLAWTFDFRDAEAAEQVKKNRGIALELVTIPRGLLDPHDDPPGVWRYPMIELSRGAAGIELLGYRVGGWGLGAGPEAAVREADAGGLGLLEGWSVGVWRGDGVYEPRWFAWRDRRSGKLETRAPAVVCGAGERVVAQTLDVFGTRATAGACVGGALL